MALAHLQRVNVELGRQEPPRRCFLITSNSEIFDLLATIPAVDFGAKVTHTARGDLNTAADYCLLDPYAFLDECHLRLTGSITHDATRDISGRLGKAFRIFGSEQIKGDDANNYNKGDDVGEFRQVWGAFLRASVLEQLQSERGIHSKRRREVLFALRNAGISTSSDKDKSFVRALTERGAKMMVEAADVAIATNNVEDFVRGAPFLRLDQHQHAEQMQWLEPREFRKQLLEPTAREKLRTEAESLYTVHLMQARALVWEDRWSAATILTEFTLGLKDSLKAAGIQVGLVDGREAYLLASYCVRMHKVKADGLRRARGFIESFRVLAQGNPGLPAADRQLHALRADAEELAICTMELLEQNAPQSSNKIVNANYDSRPIGSHDVLFVDCERVENEALALVASMHSKAGFEKNDAVVLSAYLTAQQCWVNRTQAILLCGGQAGEIEALAAKLWRRYSEIDEGISQYCPMYKVGASRFTRTVALLAKVCSGASLSNHDSEWVSGILKFGQIRGSAPYAEWRFDAISTLFKRYKISAR